MNEMLLIFSNQVNIMTIEISHEIYFTKLYLLALELQNCSFSCCTVGCCLDHIPNVFTNVEHEIAENEKDLYPEAT